MVDERDNIGSDDNQHLINTSIANDVEDKSPRRRKSGGRIKTPAALNLSSVSDAWFASHNSFCCDQDQMAMMIRMMMMMMMVMMINMMMMKMMTMMMMTMMMMTERKAREKQIGRKTSSCTCYAISSIVNTYK